MRTAREHPDLAPVTFPATLARLAAAFVAATVLAPALLAVLR